MSLPSAPSWLFRSIPGDPNWELLRLGYLVGSPPHLVEKWEREVKQAYAFTFVKILRSVEDVVTFMNKAQQNSPQTLNIGILSREAAKLGEGWSVAVNWQQAHSARWPHDAPRPKDEQGNDIPGERIVTVEQPVCPTCGSLVTDEKNKSHHEWRSKKLPRGVKARQPAVAPTPVNAGWLNRIPRFCGHCNAALWTKVRTFSKGKKVNGNPKNPRVPLAEFIATRYADRLFLYIADEIHECKSAATDQGESMMVLANAATKTLGLTGTLYGGCGAF